MRIGIVNDLAVACEALRRVVVADPALSVAWIAHDGDQAIAAAARDKPDLILMDLIMPRVNGVEATRAIMRATPCPILVVTATVSGNAGLVYEALGAGALDAVNTPTVGARGVVTGGSELVRRIHLAARASGLSTAKPAVPSATPFAPSPRIAPAFGTPSTPPSASSSSNSVPLIVAIGASTGGPRATATLLSSLPRNLPAAIVIVQHVSTSFITGYAEWLAAETNRSITLARTGMQLRVGDIVLAAEERHLVVNRVGAVEYRDEPVDHIHRPAVDELFSSLAATTPPGVAVLLTGMGRDGAESLLKARRAGWHTIAQDEKSSIVWGMPGAAHKLSAAVETLALEAIGPAIAAIITTRTKAREAARAT